MKIGKVAGVETRLLEMPYTKPLVTATNNFTVARGLLVKVITDGGVEGYGYSDLFPRTGETPAHISRRPSVDQPAVAQQRCPGASRALFATDGDHRAR